MKNDVDKKIEKKLKVEIVDISFEGLGVAKADNKVVFVKNAVVGDVVVVKVTKEKKNYMFADVVEYVTYSPDRIEPVCKVSDSCGGCSFLRINYEKQLEVKKNYVINSLKNINEIDSGIVSDVIPNDSPFRYRNKVQVQADNVRGKLKFGFYRQNSNSIVPTTDCCIIPKEFNNIIKKVEKMLNDNSEPAYDLRINKGIVRNLFIRQGFGTKEIMVCLVVNTEDFKYKKQLVEVLKNIDNVKSIMININRKRTNELMGYKSECLYGNDYINDVLDGIKYKISLQSFYQVNPVQTVKLYNTVKEFADITKDDVVLDVYSGIGTISLALAKYAKEVIGIEIVKEAVEDANINKELNNIENVTFVEGDADDEINEILENGTIADVVIIDPPRKGCELSAIEAIINNGIDRVVYVSCEPKSLANDLKVFISNGYKVEKIQPVDMFSQTVHVETCVLLSHKNS